MNVIRDLENFHNGTQKSFILYSKAAKRIPWVIQRSPTRRFRYKNGRYFTRIT